MVNIENTGFSTGAFERILYRLVSDLQAGRLPTIDLSPYSFLDLGALSYLLALGFAAREGKLIKNLEIPPIPIILPQNRIVKKFLFKTEFFGFAALNEVFVGANDLSRQEEAANRANTIGRKPPILIDDGERYPYMPFHRIVHKSHKEGSIEYFENECRGFVNDIITTFSEALIEHLGFSREMTEGFWEPNKEIFQNIYMHSKSWGFGAIQCLADRVIICYADIGVGVRETLEPFKEEILTKLSYCRSWNDGTAIIAAFEKNLTCLPGKSPGNGLHLLKSYVISNSATMEYRSGKAKVILSPRSRIKGSFVEYIPGVQIRISIPVPKRR